MQWLLHQQWHQVTYVQHVQYIPISLSHTIPIHEKSRIYYNHVNWTSEKIIPWIWVTTIICRDSAFISESFDMIASMVADLFSTTDACKFIIMNKNQRLYCVAWYFKVSVCCPLHVRYSALWQKTYSSTSEHWLSWVKQTKVIFIQRQIALDTLHLLAKTDTGLTAVEAFAVHVIISIVFASLATKSVYAKVSISASLWRAITDEKLNTKLYITHQKKEKKEKILKYNNKTLVKYCPSMFISHFCKIHHNIHAK